VHDAVFHEISIERKIQATEQVEKFRPVYTPFIQSGDARSTQSDRCRDLSTSPRPLSI